MLDLKTKQRIRKRLQRRRKARKLRAKGPNPLRIDPTKTATLRREFMAALKKRFSRLKFKLHQLIVVEDALGLRVTDGSFASLMTPPEMERLSIINAFCPTGEGGGQDNSCSPSNKGGGGAPSEAGSSRSEKIKAEILAKAAKIQFSDEARDVESQSVIGPRDYDAIEDSLSPGEREELEEYLMEQRDQLVESYTSDMDLDVPSREDIATESGYSPGEVHEAGEDRINQYVNDNELATKLKEKLGDQWTSHSEPDDLYRIIGESGGPELAKALREYATEANAEIDRGVSRAEEQARESVEESILEQYDDSDDRRGWLSNFYGENTERFQMVADDLPRETWFRDRLNTDDRFLYFETSAGAGYNIVAAQKFYRKIQSTVHDIQFSDSEGKFSITGAGKAHEVFSKVTASIASYVQHVDPEVITFSAAEASRQKLYDRLTKTIAKAFPDYFAVAYSTSENGPRYYGAIKRDSREEILKHLKEIGLDVDIVVNKDWSLKDEEFVWNAFCPYLIFNNRWRFQSKPEQIKAFQAWLRAQVKIELLGKDDEEVWRRYVEEGFRRGAGRSFDDVNTARKRSRFGPKEGDFYKGSKQQFLRDSFAQPVAVEKVKLLAGRTLDDLEGVTQQMSTVMVRDLTNGLVMGQSPEQIAAQMSEDVDTIGIQRATVIARTEIIRAHAEGQLQALEDMGVEEVGVAVEWSTAGDDKVCPACAPMEGVVLKLAEAHNLIPRHPNCVVGETVIEAPDSVAIMSAEYTGTIVELTVANGRKLAVTVNHIVLTQRGWVFAKDITDRDYLVDTSWISSSSLAPYDDHRQSNIRKVFESAIKVLNKSRVSKSLAMPEDLHGDGVSVESEIQIVSTDGVLWNELDSTPQAQTVKSFLFDRNIAAVQSQRLKSKSLLSELLERAASAADCLVRSLGVTDILLARSLGHHKPVGVGVGSDLMAEGLDNSANGFSLQLELQSESVNAAPAQELLDDLVRGKLVKVERCTTRHVERLQVYDVNTKSSAYAANGIITSNCRCAFIPANVGEDDEGQKTTAKEVRRALRESAQEGKDDEDFGEWGGLDVEVSTARPRGTIFNRLQSAVNVFCPTGEGGGIDPTCSPGGASKIEPLPKGVWKKVSPGMPEFERYRSQLYRLIQTAYAEIGGHIKIKDESSLDRYKYWLVNDMDDDPEIDVVIFGKGEFGVKSAGVGHDGSEGAVKMYKNEAARLRRGEDPTSPHWWGEASGKAAYMLMSRAVPAVEDEKKVAKLLGKDQWKWLGDHPDPEAPELFKKYHGWYEKDFGGGHKHVKIILGIPDLAEQPPATTKNEWSPVKNVFCPNGPGGGVDPTCSPGGVATKPPSWASQDLEDEADALTGKDPHADRQYSERLKSIVLFKEPATEHVVNKFIDDYLPSGTKIDDLALAAGCQPGSVVKIGHKTRMGRSIVVIRHYNEAAGIEYATRKLEVDGSGGLHIHNDVIEVSEDKRGSGIGLKVFSQQVEEGKRLGAKTIKCHAAGSYDPTGREMNGYATWPLLGYNGAVSDLERSVRLKVRDTFPQATTVLDVIETPEVTIYSASDAREIRTKMADLDGRLGRPVKERKVITGRDWWTVHGSDIFDAEFNLDDGSRSWEVLNRYRAAKSKKGGR